MSKNQGPHHAPDEPKARALALRAEGYSLEHISELVATPVRTVTSWIARGREVALNEETPAMMHDWMRIVRRSQGMQHAVLDVLEGYVAVAQNAHPGPLAEIARQVAGKELLKHAQTMNIYAGTGSDKIQKDTQPIQAQTVIVNFIEATPPSPDVVEGELVE